MDHTKDLIDELDSRFGNQYAPKHYLCIQEATRVLRKQHERITELEEYIALRELNDIATS